MAEPQKKCVLIVEDNELNKKLFRDLLEANGYKTLHTANGMEVLPLARENKPDLILMDIQLPEVSGLEITAWLKKDPELKSIPVVALTAFAMKGDEERIRQGGCEAYISKPISVAKFLETVRFYLGDARAARNWPKASQAASCPIPVKVTDLLSRATVVVRLCSCVDSRLRLANVAR